MFCFRKPRVDIEGSLGEFKVLVCKPYGSDLHELSDSPNIPLVFVFSHVSTRVPFSIP